MSTNLPSGMPLTGTAPVQVIPADGKQTLQRWLAQAVTAIGAFFLVLPQIAPDIQKALPHQTKWIGILLVVGQVWRASQSKSESDNTKPVNLS